MNEDNDFDKFRTSVEIARRAIVLHCVVAAAHGVSKDDLNEWLQEQQLWTELTPSESEFMARSETSTEEYARSGTMV